MKEPSFKIWIENIHGGYMFPQPLLLYNDKWLLTFSYNDWVAFLCNGNMPTWKIWYLWKNYNMYGDEWTR